MPEVQCSKVAGSSLFACPEPILAPASRRSMRDGSRGRVP